jgi:hypothetical protein
MTGAGHSFVAGKKKKLTNLDATEQEARREGGPGARVGVTGRVRGEGGQDRVGRGGLVRRCNAALQTWRSSGYINTI